MSKIDKTTVKYDYSKLIGFLQENNIRSKEIDGICDENGDRKIDSPDGKNSKKEWEYFFKNPGKYPVTASELFRYNEIRCKYRFFEPPTVSFVNDNTLYISKNDFAVLFDLINFYSSQLNMNINIMRTNRADLRRSIYDLVYCYVKYPDIFIPGDYRYDYSSDDWHKVNTVMGKMTQKLLALAEKDPTTNMWSCIGDSLLPAAGISALGYETREKIVIRFIRNVKDKFGSRAAYMKVLSDPSNGTYASVSYTNGMEVQFKYTWDTFNDSSGALKYAMDTLPENFFWGLPKIIFTDFSDPENDAEGGHYNPYNGEITISAADSFLPKIQNSIIHELFHKWHYLNINDIGIFQPISWGNFKAGPDEFCGTGGNPLYGQTNTLEDLATLSVYVTSPVDLRKHIRTLMSEGKFELAIKYLYVKYMMPFHGHEYQLSADSMPLNIKEVKNNIKLWRKKHPGSIRKTTKSALDNIIEHIKVYEKYGITKYTNK